MKNSGHPDFLRVAIFVTAGSFAGAGALFLLLLVFTERSQDGPLTSILPNPAATDPARNLRQQTETLRELVRSYDQQLKRDRKLIERQQALITRLENASLPPVSAESSPKTVPLTLDSPEAEAPPLPSVSTPPPAAAKIVEAAIPEIAPPGNPVATTPPPESPRQTWPKGLFAIVIREGGAALRIEPTVADEEPLRELQAGETFTVTRVLPRTDGVWYELRYGWIKHGSRIEQIEPEAKEAGANLLLPGQFVIQVHHGVNLYPVPSRKSIWNLKLLADGERYIVTSERRQENGTWYELRYGWVKKTDRIAQLGKKTNL